MMYYYFEIIHVSHITQGAQNVHNLCSTYQMIILYPISYTASNYPSPTEQFGELWTQVEIQNYLRKLERCMTEQVNKIWDPPPPRNTITLATSSVKFLNTFCNYYYYCPECDVDS